MKYYFAYGSNMNFKQMKERCPDARFLKRAYLEGYRFVYDGYSKTRKGAVANIVEAEGKEVWGGLFEVSEECIKSLDSYEGYPISYKRKVLTVKDDKGNTYEAIVYLREPQQKGKPSEEYRKMVLEGAKDCGLPEEYIKQYLEADYG